MTAAPADRAGGAGGAGGAEPDGGAGRSVRPWRFFSPRRAVYPLVALPVDVVALVLLAVGRAATGQALRVRVASALGALYTVRPTVVSRLIRSVLSLVVLASAGQVWLALLRKLAYPLTSPDVAHAWGGPTMAGAWAVHALIGVALFCLLGLPLLNLFATVVGLEVPREIPAAPDAAPSDARSAD